LQHRNKQKRPEKGRFCLLRCEEWVLTGTSVATKCRYRTLRAPARDYYCEGRRDDCNTGQSGRRPSTYVNKFLRLSNKTFAGRITPTVPTRRKWLYSASAMARPRSDVLAVPPTSGVRGPSTSAISIASTIAFAASGCPRCSSIIAPDQIWPIGLAMALP